MKKGVLLLLLLCFTSAFASENQNNIGVIQGRLNLYRGEEQFRTNVIFKDLELNGMSNSNQYVEYIGYGHGEYKHNAKYDKTKSFLIGTNSNLVANPNVFAGISLGHFKSSFKVDGQMYKVRTYGFNYFVGYNRENTLFIAKLGYDESKNVVNGDKYRSKNYLVGGEVGHIYPLGEKTRVYPFAIFNINKYEVKAHNQVPHFSNNIPSLGAGVNFVSVLRDKFLVNSGLQWNYDLKEQKYKLSESVSKKLADNYGQFNVQLGYFIDPDFLFTVGYRYLLSSKYRYDFLTFGLSHNF